VISFLVLHIVLLSLQKSLSLVASTRHARVTLRVYLRLAVRPSAGTFLGQWKKGPPAHAQLVELSELAKTGYLVNYSLI
jgi:hypothetical protein